MEQIMGKERYRIDYTCFRGLIYKGTPRGNLRGVPDCGLPVYRYSQMVIMEFPEEAAGGVSINILP